MLRVDAPINGSWTTDCDNLCTRVQKQACNVRLNDGLFDFKE